MTTKYCATVCMFVCVVGIYAGVVPAKIYYCMDPDTKILHPVNTSWPSSTFCGNYTCRMRKKGQMDLEYSPSNIVNIDKNNTKNGTEEKNTADALNLLQKDFIKKPLDQNDRYLTEDEIKTITTLLHTAKKSDLDAIIEIYNLAQVIYKEMDKEIQGNDNKPTSGVDKEKVVDIKSVPNSHVSYWYEPMNVRGSINKAHKGSKAVDLGVKSYINPIMRVSNAQTYYQPIGPFQKKFSYAHYNQPPTSYPPMAKTSTVGEIDSLSCDKPLAANYVAVSPWFSKVMRPQFPITSDKRKESSLLLPYPFAYMHHHNLSSYPRSPYFTQTYHDNRSLKLPQEAVFLINQDLLEDVRDASIKAKRDVLSESFDKLAMPEQAKANLKTTSHHSIIPTDVATSKIKVNKAKPLLIKKLSFENNSDKNKNIIFKRDLMKSSEMSIQYDNFETYIEKTMCKPEKEPGFYAIGDESRPFPECCPQRIRKPLSDINN